MRVLYRFVLRLLWVGLVPVVLVAGIVFALVDMPAAFRGARGGGTPGNLVVTTVCCQDRYDSWNGRFSSDDGSVAGRLVGYADSPPAGTEVGDTIRARYPGGLDAYAPTPGIGEWVSLAGRSLLCLLGPLLVRYWIRATWLSRRQEGRTRDLV
jgi:hypothetical protein